MNTPKWSRRAYCVVLLLLLGAFAADAQTNGNFNTVSCTLATASGIIPNAFSNGCVSGWSSSHGTPDVISNYGGIAAFSTPYCAYLTSSEGIFASYPFEQGSAYTITYRVARTDEVGAQRPDEPGTAVRYNLTAASGLVSATGSLPAITSKQVIHDYSYKQNTWLQVTVHNFVPNANYSQLWILPVSNNFQALYIDDVVITKACVATITYQNLTFTNASAAAGSTILAGANVDNTRTAGNVTVPTGATVTFKAGSAVELKPGFTAAAGSAFRAFIGACTTPTSTCFDGVRNNDETGVDCGGSCTPCVTAGARLSAEGNRDNVQLTAASLFASPNPASDALQVTLMESVAGELAVFDLAGRKVKQIAGHNVQSGTYHVQVSDLRPGLYVLRLTSIGKTLSKKIVIVR